MNPSNRPGTVLFRKPWLYRARWEADLEAWGVERRLQTGGSWQTVALPRYSLEFALKTLELHANTSKGVPLEEVPLLVGQPETLPRAYATEQLAREYLILLAANPQSLTTTALDRAYTEALQAMTYDGLPYIEALWILRRVMGMVPPEERKP